MELITISHAAQLLGVSPSSLKRWVDEGEIRCVRTKGGHRRFDRTELVRFRDTRHGRKDDLEARLLGQLLSDPAQWFIQPILLEARNALGSWSRVADMLGELIQDIGDRWGRGVCDVHSEHAASHGLEQALTICGGTLPAAPTSPCCMLATVEGDNHTLGLSLLELCAREAGWATRWLGAPTPTVELVTAIEEVKPAVVAVSASAYSDDARVLAGHVRKIGRACKRSGCGLLLGGKGAWPKRPAHGQRLATCVAFAEALPSSANIVMAGTG